jgi:hypothetical protein
MVAIVAGELIRVVSVTMAVVATVTVTRVAIPITTRAVVGASVVTVAAGITEADRTAAYIQRNTRTMSMATM